MSYARWALRTLPYIGALTVAIGQAPAPARPLRLLGAYDFETGSPIEGARVTDVSSGSYVLTSRTGTANLAFLPDGGGYVTVAKLGYESWMQFVHLTPTDTAPITLVLRPITPTLPGIFTRDTARHYQSPGMREFQSRLSHGLGDYIVDSVLRKNESLEMSSVLARLPGVAISCSKRTPRRCIAKTATPSSCPAMLVYRDGMRMTDGDLLQIPVSEIGGVEVYSSAATVPAQYSTGGGCGVILFWSRTR
jgi:hypothetical protein